MKCNEADSSARPFADTAGGSTPPQAHAFTRLFGLVSSTSGTYEHFCMAFGLYQSLWLLLLFLVVIVSLPYAFFINLGIFLGVMQTFFPVSGLY